MTYGILPRKCKRMKVFMRSRFSSDLLVDKRRSRKAKLAKRKRRRAEWSRTSFYEYERSMRLSFGSRVKPSTHALLNYWSKKQIGLI